MTSFLFQSLKDRFLGLHVSTYAQHSGFGAIGFRIWGLGLIGFRI